MMSTEQRSDTDTVPVISLEYLWSPAIRRCVREDSAPKHGITSSPKVYPPRDNDVFKYVHLRNLYPQKFVAPSSNMKHPKNLPILPECKKSVLVFLNGSFRPDLSNIESTLKAYYHPSSQRSDSAPTTCFLNSQWTRTLKEETDPFATPEPVPATGRRFHLRCPQKPLLKLPYRSSISLMQRHSRTMMHPRMQIFVGSQSELNLVNTWHHVSGEGYAINSVTDLAIEDNAHVKFVQNAMEFPETYGSLMPCAYSIKRQSTFKYHCCDKRRRHGTPRLPRDSRWRRG